MPRPIARIGMAALITLFIAAPLFAQSSGNFASQILTPQCKVNDGTGAITDGITGTLMQTTIKTNGSESTALLIRPSLVTGLFTKTKITQYDTSATAIAGVQVRVLLDGKIVAPGKNFGFAPNDTPGGEGGWVYYDKRFQQLSSNLFGQITTCGLDSTTECFIDLVLSTLSAHSLDFVAGNVGVGDHTLQVQWKLTPSEANANESACVGPGVLSVQQVKTFATGGGIVIDPTIK